MTFSALLEARGLPSHLFGALGPRMHQLLHRSMSGGKKLHPLYYSLTHIPLLTYILLLTNTTAVGVRLVEAINPCSVDVRVNSCHTKFCCSEFYYPITLCEILRYYTTGISLDIRINYAIRLVTMITTD